MEAYTGFAEVYDNFMDNIPYDKWTDYVIQLLKEYGIDQGLIVDLGCGTGNVTMNLAKASYDMIGLDNSIDMLDIAREKAEDNQLSILYLCQDMRELELYGTVKAAVSICDSMNYILELEDLVHIIRLVNNYLDSGGIFIFDLNTIYKYETLLADHTIAEDREDMSFIWDNYYDKEETLNEYNLSIFLREEEDLYRKYEETHYQKAYSLDQIKEAVTRGGMEFITAYDAFTHNPPHDHSERLYIVAREKKTDGKLYIEE